MLGKSSNYREVEVKMAGVAKLRRVLFEGYSICGISRKTKSEIKD